MLTALLIAIVLTPLIITGITTWQAAPPYFDDDDL